MVHALRRDGSLALVLIGATHLPLGSILAMKVTGEAALAWRLAAALDEARCVRNGIGAGDIRITNLGLSNATLLARLSGA